MNCKICGSELVQVSRENPEYFCPILDKNDNSHYWLINDQMDSSYKKEECRISNYWICVIYHRNLTLIRKDKEEILSLDFVFDCQNLNSNRLKTLITFS